MRKILCIVLILCGLLCGCMQQEAPDATATVAATRRPSVPELTASPVTSPTLPLLTPKASYASEAPEFSALVLEGSEAAKISMVAILLEGNSVDIVNTIEVTGVRYCGGSVGFRPLGQDEITALENMYSTAMFYGIVINSYDSGTYELTLKVTHKSGEISQANISVEIDNWVVYE